MLVGPRAADRAAAEPGAAHGDAGARAETPTLASCLAAKDKEKGRNPKASGAV